MSHGRLPSIRPERKPSPTALAKRVIPASAMPYTQSASGPWEQNIQENCPLPPDNCQPWPIPQNSHLTVHSQHYPVNHPPPPLPAYPDPTSPEANIVIKEIRDISFPVTGKMAMATVCLQQIKQSRYISIDTDDKPQCLQDAFTRYIDFLVQENEVKTSISLSKYQAMPCQFERERYFYEALHNSVQFPTPKFKEWIKLYGMDIEVGEATECQENSVPEGTQENALKEKSSRPTKHRSSEQKSRSGCQTPKVGMKERLGLTPQSPGLAHLLSQLSDLPVVHNTSLTHDHFLAALEDAQQKEEEEEEERTVAGKSALNMSASFDLFSPASRRTFNLVNSPKAKRCKMDVPSKKQDGLEAKNIRV